MSLLPEHCDTGGAPGISCRVVIVDVDDRAATSSSAFLLRLLSRSVCRCLCQLVLEFSVPRLLFRTPLTFLVLMLVSPASRHV